MHRMPVTVFLVDFFPPFRSVNGIVLTTSVSETFWKGPKFVVVSTYPEEPLYWALLYLSFPLSICGHQILKMVSSFPSSNADFWTWFALSQVCTGECIASEIKWWKTLAHLAGHDALWGSAQLAWISFVGLIETGAAKKRWSLTFLGAAYACPPLYWFTGDTVRLEAGVTFTLPRLKICLAF